MKCLGGEIRPLQKHNVREMNFINHVVPEFKNVLVNPFNSISSYHQILVLVLALLDSQSNLLSVVSLMLRFTDKDNPVSPGSIHNFNYPAIRFNT